MKLKKAIFGAVALSLSASLISSCNENKEKTEVKPTEKPQKVENAACLPAEKVDKNKIKSIFSKFGADVEIVKVEMSPIKNLYKVIIKAGDRYTVAYMDCNLNYLISGVMIDIKEKRNLTQETVMEYQLKAQAEKKKIQEENLKKLESILGKEKFEGLKKVLGINMSHLQLVDLKNIPTEGVVIYGNLNAKYTVYVISDPQCPFCARLHQSIKDVIAKDKDVKFEIILYPLPFHEFAEGISENIASQSDMEKRKELLDKSFKAVEERSGEKLKSLIKENKKGAEILKKHKEFSKSVNLQGTPMIIFPVGDNKGIAINGAIPTDLLAKIINVLKK